MNENKCYILINNAFASRSNQNNTHTNKERNPLFLLDSGCTLNIYQPNTPGVYHISGPPQKVIGIEGKINIRKPGYHKIFGKGIILKDCPANLLSLSQLFSNKFEIKFDNNSNKIVAKKGKAEYIFSCTNKLYQHEAKNRNEDLALISLQERGIYNKFQTERAKEVQKLHHVLGHPSDTTLCELLSKNGIAGTTLSRNDVINSTKLFGKCISCELAKSTNINGPSSSNEISDIIGNTLHIDIAYIGDTNNKQTYLITVDEASGYITSSLIPDRNSDTLFKKLIDIINFYKANDLIVKNIRSDSEPGLAAIKLKLQEKGILLTQMVANAHEKKAERNIRTLKEKIRSIAFSLEFKIPKCLNEHLVEHATQCMNCLPNVHTSGIMPHQIVTGNKISINDLNVTFGDIILTHVSKENNNDSSPRSELMLVIGRDILASGVVKCISLLTRKIVRRKIFKKQTHNILNAIRLIESWRTSDNSFYHPNEQVRNLTKENLLNEKLSEINKPTLLIPLFEPKALSTQSNNANIEQIGANGVNNNNLILEAIIEQVNNINIEENNQSFDSNAKDLEETIEKPFISKPIDSDKMIEQNSVPETNNQEDGNTKQIPHKYNLRRNPKKTSIMELSGKGASATWHPKSEQNINKNHIKQSTDTEKQLLPSKPIESKEISNENLEKSDSQLHTTNHPDLACMSLRDGLRSDEQLTIKATIAEWKQMINKNVFHPIHRQDIKGAITVKSSIIITLKPDKVKARLVAGGNQQPRDVYRSDETSSSTVRTPSILSIIAISAAKDLKITVTDITGAYLNASLPSSRNIVMKIQKEVVDILKTEIPTIIKYIDYTGAIYVSVTKAIYGLIESGVLWNQHLTNTLINIGYEQIKSDRCVFKKKTNKKTTYICIYVDDIMIATNDEDERNQLIARLENIYGEMKKQTGDHISYRGLQIDQSHSNGIKISQEKYIKELLEFSKVKGTAPTPCTDSYQKINMNYEKPAVDASRYGKITAKLNWIACQSRPDIKFAVSILATKLHNPTVGDEKRMWRLLKYLNATPNIGLLYKKKDMIIVNAYSDASHLTHLDCKGHTGALIMLGESIIESISKKQSITSLSSTEAELISLSTTLNSVLWTRNLIEELGFPQNPSTIYQDNQSAIQMGETGKLTNRTKHMGVRFYNIHDHIKNGNIKLEYIKTEKMKADILTKSKGPTEFLKARNMIA